MRLQYYISQIFLINKILWGPVLTMKNFHTKIHYMKIIRHENYGRRSIISPELKDSIALTAATTYIEYLIYFLSAVSLLDIF